MIRRLLRPSAILICSALSFAPAAAQEARDGVADALAGHAAEMRQLSGEVDALRRPLFFDPVDAESAPAGVPCDHLARRRPESIAGRGWVALLRAHDGRLARYWVSPEQRADSTFVEKEARDFAAATLKTSDFALVALRSFAWCR